MNKMQQFTASGGHYAGASYCTALGGQTLQTSSQDIIVTGGLPAPGAPMRGVLMGSPRRAA
jgi:hypothetical protein